MRVVKAAENKNAQESAHLFEELSFKSGTKGNSVAECTTTETIVFPKDTLSNAVLHDRDRNLPQAKKMKKKFEMSKERLLLKIRQRTKSRERAINLRCSASGGSCRDLFRIFPLLRYPGRGPFANRADGGLAA